MFTLYVLLVNVPFEIITALVARLIIGEHPIGDRTTRPSRLAVNSFRESKRAFAQALVPKARF